MDAGSRVGTCLESRRASYRRAFEVLPPAVLVGLVVVHHVAVIPSELIHSKVANCNLVDCVIDPHKRLQGPVQLGPREGASQRLPELLGRGGPVPLREVLRVGRHPPAKPPSSS